MADATLACYGRALAEQVVEAPHQRFANRRIRDALGYEPWRPPAVPMPQVEPASVDDQSIVTAPRGLMARVARRALAMRTTPMGRVLYRMTPAPVIDALKSRLDG
jgi:hypothetical protein